MKFTARDLVKLRLPMLGTLALFILAGLFAWWSQRDAEKAEHERNAATASKNQIEQRLRQVRTEEQELKDRAHIFQKMQNFGITGEEKRLDWTESLRLIQQEMRLPGMNYEFGVQKPLENVNGAAYAYFASPMRLQLRLLHEEDLITFLARVQKEAKALVLVRSCKLSPLGSQAAGRATAQLGADCELQWVTVRRSNGKK
ncbi:MAG: hypothetical protein Q8S26_00375 [Azonexus sp.]|nr:hypothetical protein [Azonexus sp.]